MIIEVRHPDTAGFYRSGDSQWRGSVAKILIAGAGIGGLAAAIGLIAAGHEVEIFEQAPQLAEIGAGLQLSANAMHVLRHLGLEQAIARVGVAPAAYVFRLHDTGEVVQRFALAEAHERMHAAPYLQLHRADLHAALVDRLSELDPNVVRLNKRLVHYREEADGVHAHFADGTSARGELLVGADGLKSVVRREIVGDAGATYTGDAAWRIVVPTSRLPKDFLERAMHVFMGPGGHVVCYYLRAGELVNFVGMVETDEVSEESWTVKLPWQLLKSHYAGWHPIIQTVIDAADRDECYRWSLFARPPVDNWSTERTTLIGDAAHPTLPYLAQGAAMAIEDGAVLRRALETTSSIPQALQVYQRNRLARTARIVNQSAENRSTFHRRSVAEIRAYFTRRNEGEDRNTWLYSYNALTVPLL